MFRPLSENSLFLANFLQTEAWADFQKKQGRTVFSLPDSQNRAVYVFSYPLPFGKNYFYCPRGPMNVNLKDFLTTLQNRRNQQILFLKIEPPLPDSPELRQFMKTNGFVPDKDTQPRETLILNLRDSETNLLKNMEHNTRYSIRAAAKRGVLVRRSPQKNDEDFERFWKLFDFTNRRHRLESYSRDYYRELLSLNGEIKTELFLAEINGETIAVAIILFYRETATYLYAATAPGYGKWNAPSLLLWELIRYAQSIRCEIFDFWGASETNPRWRGITRFKKSFGGRRLAYIGTWVYIFDKKWYLLYKLGKRFLKLKRFLV